MKINLLIFLILISFIGIGQTKKDTIMLYYLGGQSNMQGYGFNKDLPSHLKKFENVYIFQGKSVGDNQPDGGIGKWEILKPGNGTDFETNGKLNKPSERFGVELSFAKKLQELYPNQKIAFIKYSRNGSSLDSLAASNFGSWEPDFKSGKGINQYDHYLKTIKNALSVSDINNDGVVDFLKPMGIIWMQGESDGYNNENVAKKYYDNLNRLMDLMRASFNDNDLPIVIGKISDSGKDKDGKVWDYGELVQFGQEKFIKTHNNTGIVRSTSQYNYSDQYHYDSLGYIDLGIKFAECIYNLNNNKNK